MFAEIFNDFVKAKESKKKDELEQAINKLEELFKTISKNNYIKYIMSEAIALQGNGLESEAVNELVKKPIATYVAESIFNKYVPIMEREINECFKGIEINKDNYKESKIQTAIGRLIEIYDKYILFDDLSEKENQILGIFKKIGIREKNFLESDKYTIKALEYYKEQKEIKKNG